MFDEGAVDSTLKVTVRLHGLPEARVSHLQGKLERFLGGFRGLCCSVAEASKLQEGCAIWASA